MWIGSHYNPCVFYEKKKPPVLEGASPVSVTDLLDFYELGEVEGPTCWLVQISEVIRVHPAVADREDRLAIPILVGLRADLVDDEDAADDLPEGDGCESVREARDCDGVGFFTDDDGHGLDVLHVRFLSVDLTVHYIACISCEKRKALVY